MDKPPGVSSARAVSAVKRLLPKKTKIGHTGTLDPLASGLLVLLIGRATRLSRYVTGLDKSYTATARFGAVSDTLDAEGEISPLDAPMPDGEKIRAALSNFTGDLLQTPPMASAVKVGGERLYSLHRRGETVERDARPVRIQRFAMIASDSEQETASFEISCGSGTYVRSLIADLATSLGTGAYVTALRRTSVGHLSVEGAAAAENLTEETISSRIIQPGQVVAHLPAVEVGEEETLAVGSGRGIGVRGLCGALRVERDGELLAVYRGEGERARAEVVLCGR